ncbi:hypothetical protein CB1_000273030 [Camelus ferus]|nr:hypothetical protein CB1_000273030 [Camelus ferus]
MLEPESPLLIIWFLTEFDQHDSEAGRDALSSAGLAGTWPGAACQSFRPTSQHPDQLWTARAIPDLHLHVFVSALLAEPRLPPQSRPGGIGDPGTAWPGVSPNAATSFPQSHPMRGRSAEPPTPAPADQGSLEKCGFEKLSPCSVQFGPHPPCYKGKIPAEAISRLHGAAPGRRGSHVFDFRGCSFSSAMLQWRLLPCFPGCTGTELLEFLPSRLPPLLLEFLQHSVLGPLHVILFLCP